MNNDYSAKSSNWKELESGHQRGLLCPEAHAPEQWGPESWELALDFPDSCPVQQDRPEARASPGQPTQPPRQHQEMSESGREGGSTERTHQEARLHAGRVRTLQTA